MNLVDKIVLALLLVATQAVPLDAQDSTANTQQPAAQSVLETLRNKVSESDLTDDEKKAILAVVGQGESETKEAEAKRKITVAQQAALASIGQRVTTAKDGIQSLQAFKPTPPEVDTLNELGSLLVQLETQLAATKQELTDIESSAAKASQRRREIETELPKIKAQLTERRAQIETAKSNPDSSLAGEARQLELEASERLIQAQAEAIQAEDALLAAESAAGFHQVQRDYKARQVETMQQQVDLVKQTLEKQRATDAARRVENANAQLATMHPALQPIGEFNKELAALNQELSSKIEAVEDVADAQNAKLDELRTSYQQAKTRVESVGLTDAVGAMLRNLKQSLPRVGVYRIQAKDRQPFINDAQYELIDLTERRNARLDVLVASLLDETDPPIGAGQRADLAEEARRLLVQQRTEFLDPAIRSQTTYFNTLVSLSTTEQQIVQLIHEATEYVNERVLWIRSTKPITSQLIPSAEEHWFLTPAAWDNVGPKLRDDIWRRPVAWCVALLALLALIRFRWRLRSEIQLIGSQVTQSTYTKFVPTVKSLLLTIATAAPLPLVFGFLASRLGSVAGSDRALLALAEAARTVAWVYFPLELLRQICRTDGLAECHFGWPAASLRYLRRRIRLLLFTLVPLLMIASFLHAGSYGFGRDILERYFFFAAMVVLSVFMFRVLHPRDGVVANYIRVHANGWGDRLSVFWFPLIVVAPFTLGVLALAGYSFTSQQLASRLFATLYLVFVISIFGAMISRWAMVHRRKLRIDQLRQQRAAEAPVTVAEVPIESTELSAESLRLQMQQTRRLLQTILVGAGLIGVSIIWHDVLSARGYLEEWPVWTSMTTISETITSETGDLVTRARDVQEKITVADIGLAILILIITFLATHNVPGLLEFAILRRLPLDPSTRYAITSLSSYMIALVGLIVAGQTAGLHWHQIQWMATALTFGLAFGLQEMFANFIAGIIILFERPVRVGDVVEIDGVTGVVTKIRIRATTITNWERKDFIVPNKEFITGKLLNWTRSDETFRLDLVVGIAYGSNTKLAHELLNKLAWEHPDVVAEPAPSAIFDGFGESSLNFTLRVFVDDYEKRHGILHDLHMAIDNAFREADIEISFPQRDLHLRTVSAPVMQDLVAGGEDKKSRRGSSKDHRDVTE